MQDIRCEKCNKLLYRLERPRHIQNENKNGVSFDVIEKECAIGTVECKCPRCGTVNTNKESVK
jgi:phage FluMu protein Com